MAMKECFNKSACTVFLLQGVVIILLSSAASVKQVTKGKESAHVNQYIGMGHPAAALTPKWFNAKPYKRFKVL